MQRYTNISILLCFEMFIIIIITYATFIRQRIHVLYLFTVFLIRDNSYNFGI